MIFYYLFIIIIYFTTTKGSMIRPPGLLVLFVLFAVSPKANAANNGIRAFNDFDTNEDRQLTHKWSQVTGTPTSAPSSDECWCRDIAPPPDIQPPETERPSRRPTRRPTRQPTRYPTRPPPPPTPRPPTPSPLGACENLYGSFFASYSSLCTYGGFVRYAIGRQGTISSSNPLSHLPNYSSLGSLSGGQFRADLGQLGFTNMVDYCSCRELSSSFCLEVDACSAGRLASFDSTLGQIDTVVGRIANQVDSQREAEVLMSFADNLREGSCLVRCQ